MAPRKRKSDANTDSDYVDDQPTSKKHKAKSTSSSAPKTTLKRGKGGPVASSSKQDPESVNVKEKKAPKSKTIKTATNGPLTWPDIPVWTRSDSPFMQLPVEILDTIMSGESGLTLQDHFAMSGTCKQIRAVYTCDVWAALCYAPDVDTPAPMGNRFIDRLFSNALENALKGPQPKPPVETRTSLRVFPSLNIIENDTQIRKGLARIVNRVISGTEAKKRFKVNDTDLATIKCCEAPNPARIGSKVRRYRIGAVRSLALRSHGGPVGHKERLNTLAARAAKANATREKNGTNAKPKHHATGWLFDSWDIYDEYDDNLYDEDFYDDDPYDDYGPNLFFNTFFPGNEVAYYDEGDFHSYSESDD